MPVFSFIKARGRLVPLLVAAAMLFAFAAAPEAALFAQEAGADAVAASAGLDTGTDVYEIIGRIINIVLGLMGVIILIIFMYAGFLWMTAGGDEKRVEKAKKMMINGVVGLVIVLFAYAITTFIINLLTDGGAGRDGTGDEVINGHVSVERLSGALGGGALRDHYPGRNETDVPRNASIIVTFRSAMDVASFIEGYDFKGTPEDRSDDTVTTSLDTDNVRIYRTEDGVGELVPDVKVSFTDDLTTFIFDPTNYLGSSSQNVSYTVELDPAIKNLVGDKVFTGANDQGYVWSFETGTVLDLAPPTVNSVIPLKDRSYARNIAVQITFSEAMNPVMASGIRKADGSGFDAIQVAAEAGPIPGTYDISNGYRTVTFLTSDACGTNSCNETIYCLPGSSTLNALINAATLGTEPPQAQAPFDGVIDIAGNSLDGNDDGTAGDDYAWQFSTTGTINLEGPKIETVTPDLGSENIALDQSIAIVVHDVLLSSSIDSDAMALTSKEMTTGEPHELWYKFGMELFDDQGLPVISDVQTPAETVIEIPHGTFLESTEGLLYLYGLTVDEDLRNQYQNCYVPAEGPAEGGGLCAVTAINPYCCDGVPSGTACTLF